MDAVLKEQYQTWRVPSSAEGLALELSGVEGCLRVRCWVEGGRDYVLLERPGPGAVSVVLYAGPLARLAQLAPGGGMGQISCPDCAWRWTPRVAQPAKCPNCSVRLRKGPR